VTTFSVDRPDATVEELRAQIAGLEAEHDQYRRNVRAEVIRQHVRGSWCLAGSQEVLAELGLPAIEMTYEGNTQLWVRIIKVAGAGDAEDAKARVIEAFEVTCSDPGIEFQLDTVVPALYQVEVQED
jgi:hypothetical protein